MTDHATELRRLAQQRWAVVYEHELFFRSCADEIERLRKELRKPQGCTYDSEGKSLTICHELATLRSETDRVHKEHAEMIDSYEAKLEEYERRIEELTEALELNPKDKHWIEGYRQGATDGAGEKP